MLTIFVLCVLEMRWNQQEEKVPGTVQWCSPWRSERRALHWSDSCKSQWCVLSFIICTVPGITHMERLCRWCGSHGRTRRSPSESGSRPMARWSPLGLGSPCCSTSPEPGLRVAGHHGSWWKKVVPKITDMETKWGQFKHYYLKEPVPAGPKLWRNIEAV